MAEIPAVRWDACANPEGLLVPENPFLSYAFLEALEASDSAVPQTGWAPAHLLLEREDGDLLAVAPTYLKSHSQGEYVFDHAFADALERAGGRYYPKLQVAVPFTPVTGRRLLVRGGVDEASAREALASALLQLMDRTGCSSAHLTFLTESEQAFLAERDFLARQDIQYHWTDEGYGDFEGFLGALASRKRKALRRERRDALSDGLSVRWITGSDLREEHWDAFWEFYQDTGARKWGQPYLTREFFSLLGERMADQVLLILAERDGRPIAGALNIIGAEALFGRYWGCVEDHPFLHFELCYYQAIDYALAHGLKRVEAGAQGGHKLARGYRPVLTHSAHAFAHPGLAAAVGDYLFRERAEIAAVQAAFEEQTPFRMEPACPSRD